jgi:hypothetical protein
MSAKLASLNKEMRGTDQGFHVVIETFAASGLTPNGANAVPFPMPLNNVPRRVYLTPTGNGAAGAVASLDTSQGAADPTNSFSGGKLGVDVDNLYVYIGNASELEITVEYLPG